AGRYRQFHQFGAEAIGDLDPALDAELIGLLLDFFAEVGLRDLNLLINTIGHPGPDCRGRYLEALRAYYAPLADRLCEDCRERLAPPRPDVYLSHTGSEAKLRADALAAELRRAGLGAVLATGDRRLRAQFRQADAVGARQALILGEDELARGVAKLHNLSDGE